MNITDTFNTYINIITQDFSNYIIDNELTLLEQLRISKIKLAINSLVKLYNNIDLDDMELNMLDEYPIKYDYKQNITKCIADIVYNINEDIHNKVMLLYFKNYNDNIKNNQNNINDSYWNYIYNLRQYNQDILHSITHNHEISIIDINTNECVKPKINFNNCIIKYTLKKKTK